jgi:hypothetical protein
MAKIIDFPGSQDREWREWEVLLRDNLRSEGVDGPVVEHALPRIREHWAVIFEPIELELPKRPVPGKLTPNQAMTIQSIIDAGARHVVDRLQHERRVAFGRLVQVEVALSRQVLQVKPSL